jgi:hypothetical protein
MARTILLAVFAAMLLICAAAQDHLPANQPFYLCNVIVVVTADDSQLLAQKLRASFIRQGFQITSWDVRTLTGKAQVNASLTETVTAIINDNSISYAGTYSYSSSGAAQGLQAATHNPADTYEIEYKGKKNSDSMAAFTKMDRLAKSFGEKTLYFFQ